MARNIPLAKKIEIILGIFMIIAMFFIGQLMIQVESIIPASLYSWLIANILILQILYGVCGAITIIGAFMLESNEKVAKILLLIVGVLTIKDLGFISIIVVLLFVKKEK